MYWGESLQFNLQVSHRLCMRSSHVTHDFSAAIECPDCNRVCEMGTLNKECTKCTCEDHIITGTVYDEQSNPIVGASLYKFGHYDKLGVTDRVGKYR